MIRRPPRSTLDRSSAASDVYKRQLQYKSQGYHGDILLFEVTVDNFIKNGCDFFFKITNKVTRKEIARAKTGIAFFDYKTNKLVPVPEKFLNLIESLKK